MSPYREVLASYKRGLANLKFLNLHKFFLQEIGCSNLVGITTKKY